MASSERIFKALLGVKSTIIESITIERDKDGFPSLRIRVRPKKRDSDRCPICGRHCPGYDKRKMLKTWRTLDFCGHRAVLVGQTHRVRCPHHGVVTAAVPWAAANSGFTYALDQSIAWLVKNLNRTAVSALMRVDWKSVGRAISRHREILEPDTRVRYNNLRYIGIDETSYRKGHKYVTVVVNHETNTVVWVGQNHGRAVLEEFFKQLNSEQCASIELVTGDGARWITECVKQYCPNCKRCVDTFHVVQWGQDAVDTVRREAWRRALQTVKELEKGLDKRPGRYPITDIAHKKVQAARNIADAVKKSCYALGKAPQHLTQAQQTRLEMIQQSDSQLYRAYLRKEELRLLLKIEDVHEAEAELKRWLWKASHSRIPAVVELYKKIRRHKEHILNTIRYKLNNARVEAINSNIKLLVKRAYGFRNVQNLMDLILLVCSNLPIQLPFRIDWSSQPVIGLQNQSAAGALL